MSENKIVKVQSELGRKLVQAGHDSLMNDLKGQFVHTTKVLIQEKMRLTDEIAKAQAAIVVLDKKLKAIEEGRVEFDMLHGKVLFPSDCEE